MTSPFRGIPIELIIPKGQAGEALSNLRGKISELGLENSSLVEVTEADGEDSPRYKITSTLRLQ